MPFWQFFRKGWDGRALLVQPSKSNRRNWKFLFVLGSCEYLERLEGKIRDGIFFCVLINQIITVWPCFSILLKICLRNHLSKKDIQMKLHKDFDHIVYKLQSSLSDFFQNFLLSTCYNKFGFFSKSFPPTYNSIHCCL